MGAQNPDQIEASEPRPAEAKLREQGLRVLARMVAWAYLCDVRPKSAVSRQPDGEVFLSAGDINLDKKITGAETELA